MAGPHRGSGAPGHLGRLAEARRSPGGVALADPGRFAGLASLYATLPFEAGVPTTPGRLNDVPVLLLQGADDNVIPVELQRRTWAYVHDESGAALRAHREAGGHSSSGKDLEILHDWINDLS